MGCELNVCLHNARRRANLPKSRESVWNFDGKGLITFVWPNDEDQEYGTQGLETNIDVKHYSTYHIIYSIHI